MGERYVYDNDSRKILEEIELMADRDKDNAPISSTKKPQKFHKRSSIIIAIGLHGQKRVAFMPTSTRGCGIYT